MKPSINASLAGTPAQYACKANANGTVWMGACPIFPRNYSQPPTLLCTLEKIIKCSSTRKPPTLNMKKVSTTFQTSALLYHSSSSCIRKNATPKVTSTRRYLLPRTKYKTIQGTRVDDSWLTRLQPVAMYVVVTTVCSGLMIIDFNTYTFSVVVAFSAVALNNKVGRSRGLAERSWHTHTQFAIEFS